VWVPIIRSGPLNRGNAELAVSAACMGRATVPSQRSDETARRVFDTYDEMRLS